MQHKTLIIKGIDSTDELGMYGIALADKFANCDRVVFISKKGNSRVVKGSEDGASLTDLQFFDAEDHLGNFLLFLKKVKNAYETAHPETKDLAHAFVGQWVFNWNFVHDDGRAIHRSGEFSVIGMMEDGKYGLVEKSADEFIEKDFGMSSVIKLRTDGTEIGPKSPDQAAGAVSSDGGPRDEH